MTQGALSRILQTEQRRIVVVAEQLAETGPAHDGLQGLFRRILGHMVFQLVQEAGLGGGMAGALVQDAADMCGQGHPVHQGASKDFLALVQFAVGKALGILDRNVGAVQLSGEEASPGGLGARSIRVLGWERQLQFLEEEIVPSGNTPVFL